MIMTMITREEKVRRDEDIIPVMAMDFHILVKPGLH